MTDLLAIDGDILAYRTAAVCEDHFEGACASILRSTLRDIATDTGITKARIYISGDDNFRYKVAKTKPYKGNRATMVRPQYLDYCKEFLIEEFGAIRVHGAEADDGIASDMVQTGAIHCGIDKDMLQIAGTHYNYVNKEYQIVDEETATITLFRQVLMGDTSDNIPGLPRIGEAKAAKAIQNFETAMLDAMDIYEEVCRQKLPGVIPLVYFQEQYDLVKMKTDLDIFAIDFDVYTTLEANTEGFEPQMAEGQPQATEVKL